MPKGKEGALDVEDPSKSFEIHFSRSLQISKLVPKYNLVLLISVGNVFNYFRSWAQMEASVSATCSCLEVQKVFHLYFFYFLCFLLTLAIIRVAEYIHQNRGFVSERSLQDWPLTLPPRVATPLLLVLTSVLPAIASLPGLISHRAVKGDQDEPGRVGPPWKLTAAARFTQAWS